MAHQQTPKGYWVAHVSITNPEAYKSYQDIAPKAFAKYGARFLARDMNATTLEGDGWQRHVIIEFDSKEQALACYHSDDYQSARAHRSDACTASIHIIEALD